MRNGNPGLIKRPAKKAANECGTIAKRLWESVPRADEAGMPTPEEFIRFLAGKAREEEQ